MGVRLLVWLLIIACVALWILRMRAGRRPRAPRTEPGWDPHAVLGVASGASRDEVSRAYREQMKRYHPDRVADMPREFQELAHRKVIEIQRAYAELGGGR